MPKGIYKRTQQGRENMKKAFKGRVSWNKGKKRPPFSEEWRKKLGEANIGSHRSNETREKMSGKNHWHWKGGLTSEYKKVRNSIEYGLWRKAVYERDGFTCQKCMDNKGGNLHPHHILNFETYKEIRLAINNGITLCDKCHIKFHRKYGYKNNTKEQLEEFLKV